MFWHNSSLVTARSGRYAPTLSNPTLVGPLVVAICFIAVPDRWYPAGGERRLVPTPIPHCYRIHGVNDRRDPVSSFLDVFVVSSYIDVYDRAVRLARPLAGVGRRCGEQCRPCGRAARGARTAAIAGAPGGAPRRQRARARLELAGHCRGAWRQPAGRAPEVQPEEMTHVRALHPSSPSRRRPRSGGIP